VSLLLAADAVVAGVHADLDLTDVADLGWKALAVNLSDLAAMGGDPGHAVVTVAGPRGTDLGRLYDGLGAAAAHYRCPVVGGDLSGAPVLMVSVAVTGWLRRPPVLRSGARPGDRVWVTGPLGASAAGLRLLRRRREGGSLPVGAAALMAAHARPEPRLGAGRAAADAGATAMIDVSDGLLADLGHIADASGVGFDLDAVPVAEGATEEEALGGGEDYQLIVCTRGDSDLAGVYARAGLAPPTPVGTCTPDPGRRRLRGEAVGASGWQHDWS
jgi:thiamine-monophosphate kinase